MKNKNKELLEKFQCDYNRSIEESFAQMLTENESVRLFFINENQAFTDGQNIVVDPAVGEVFADKEALQKTEEFLRIRAYFSLDPWYALRMITRAQNIHECLHILYTDFPSGIVKDPRSTTKARQKTLAMIGNIIEDAFIEAAGCSVFDNLELYLKFVRVALLFSKIEMEGTVSRIIGEAVEVQENKPIPLVEYLNYMATFSLYPMVKQEPPIAEIAGYVDKTKQLFLDGSICGEPKKRYAFTQQIFDIIEPLIPDSDDIDDSYLQRVLLGHKTHSGESQTINSIGSNGRSVTITRRLFAGVEGNDLPNSNFDGQVKSDVVSFENEKQIAIQIVTAEPIVVNWKGTQFDCAKIHNDIHLIETKPKPNLNLRRAYQNIYNKYQININSYNGRFVQLLKAKVPVKEGKKLFGTGVDSRRLYDAKKRYWYRNAEEYGIPDIAVLLLIDGSGSMFGQRRESAIISSVILHEVLKKQGITHAIVEHRAIYDQPTVHHNILVDFASREEEKLNILALDADEGTREGLSLYWAEKHITSKTTNERRLIIVLSDGIPAHGIEGLGDYMPPVSIKDTQNAAIKIMRRGTDIIAVALDDENSDYSCYKELKRIYTSVVACTDLKQLTGQLLRIISNNLR